MNALRLGSAGDTPFELPLDALTTAFGIIGRRGSGKTSTAVVMVEEFAAHGLPVVIIDPLGVWHGLRSSADGESPGLPVTILGGQHGDLPLEQTAGVLVADLVVEHPGAYVIDLSGFESRSAERRFATDFAERLYRAKAKETSALCLVVDEADTFAPQQVRQGEERLLGAFEAIARRGRVRGLGMVLITQRPAVLNKNLLSQIECLIALQITAPQDRDALKAWAQGFADKAEVEAFLGSLAGLHVGEAWIWSPSWLQIFQRVDIRRRQTFDSSATPKAGEVRVEPRVLAPVDLEALRVRMAETIEKAEADDPKKLRVRIGELERQLRTPIAPIAPASVTCDHEPVIAALNARNGELTSETFRLGGIIESLTEHIRLARNALPEPNDIEALALQSTPEKLSIRDEKASNPAPAVPPNRVARASAGLAGGVAREDGSASRKPAGAGPDISRPQRAIIDVLATFTQLGVASLKKEHAALFAGASPKSSAFSNNLGALRTAGLIDYPRGGYLSLTGDGAAIAQARETIVSSQQLQQAWFKTLKSGPQERILSLLVDRYPDAVDKISLAELAGASITSSAFSNNLGRLRSLGLISYPAPGYVAATDMLFLEGVRG